MRKPLVKPDPVVKAGDHTRSVKAKLHDVGTRKSSFDRETIIAGL